MLLFDNQALKCTKYHYWHLNNANFSVNNMSGSTVCQTVDVIYCLQYGTKVVLTIRLWRGWLR